MSYSVYGLGTEIDRRTIRLFYKQMGQVKFDLVVKSIVGTHRDILWKSKYISLPSFGVSGLEQSLTQSYGEGPRSGRVWY